MARPLGTKKDGVIKYLNEDQLARFMKAIKVSKRDDFLFSIALFLGLRVGEIVKIRLKDIVHDSNQIYIKGLKNGLSRYYSLPGKLWKKYLRWMKVRNDIIDSEKNPYLFISNHGYYDLPMTEQAVKYNFKKYAEIAGLDTSFSVHCLRHSSAIIRVKAGHSAPRIQKWLRHKTIMSSMVYFDLAGPDLEKDEREALEAFENFI